METKRDCAENVLNHNPDDEGLLGGSITDILGKDEGKDKQQPAFRDAR